MARKTVKLHMPKGTDEVNYGDHSYPVDHDGEVEVPPEVAGPLIKEGGAIEEGEVVIPDDVIPEGWVRIQHQYPGASITVDHISYTTGDDRTVLVPQHIAAVCEPHGFTVIPA